MLGSKTNTRAKATIAHLREWSFIDTNVFLSAKISIKQLNKKYMAAYLARNAKPKNIPNKKKFITEPFSLISKSFVIDNTQNKRSKRSVEIKNDETLAAGINKKLKEQITELFFDIYNCKQSL